MYSRDSTDEEVYGTIQIKPLIYIEDISRSNTDLNSLRADNKFSSMEAENQLSLHPRQGQGNQCRTPGVKF